MKKITLLFLFAISATAFSQSSLVGLYGPSEGTIYIQNELLMDPCSEEAGSNGLENAGFFGGATNQRLAIDIDVDADVAFSIETFTLNVAVQATGFALIFREDDGTGLPGDEISTLLVGLDFSITNEELIGNNFGRDFYTYSFELDEPLELIGATATGTKYWMEVESNAEAWESTTMGTVGLTGAFNNDSTGGLWALGTTEYVYSISGECNPALSVGDNLQSLVSIYPNPSSDILNVKVPSSVQINEVSLFDLLGRNTGSVFANGIVDISTLSKGVYMLTVNTTGGSITKKVVKK